LEAQSQTSRKCCLKGSLDAKARKAMGELSWKLKARQAANVV